MSALEPGRLDFELDGERVEAWQGETILDVARRRGRDIPTLCADPRLDPAAACRACLVEVEGAARLLPACATPVCDGMAVRTESPRVERHRRTLFALYLTDHPRADIASAGHETRDRLLDYARRYAAPLDWGRMRSRRRGRPDDRNPYIEFDAERCVLCAQCTRYCEEVEGVAAIGLAWRGAETTVFTADGASLLDGPCEMCGGCVDVCPTGALSEKSLPAPAGQAGVTPQPVRTTCGYCGVGCQLDVWVDRAARQGRGRIVKITSPPPGTTTNDGNLCVKGRFGYGFVHHRDRLESPLVRGEDGELRQASWQKAIARAAEGLLAARRRHGADALGFISSARCTVEENYLAQKLARAVFGTNNIHQCAAT